MAIWRCMVSSAAVSAMFPDVMACASAEAAAAGSKSVLQTPVPVALVPLSTAPGVLLVAVWSVADCSLCIALQRSGAYAAVPPPPIDAGRVQCS